VWNIGSRRELHPTRLDEHSHKIFVWMEPDHVGDDGQKIIWAADLEPSSPFRLRPPVTTPPLSFTAFRLPACRLSRV
jgi:hypothetical protein